MVEKHLHILAVAPCGKVDKIAFEKGKMLLESDGHKVEIGENIFQNYGPLAGTDSKRKKDLQWALDHEKADIIWMIRGGYGMSRIVDDLDFRKFHKKPKLIIGYSDVTALFLNRNLQNTAVLHANMIQSLDVTDLKSVVSLLSSGQQEIIVKSTISEFKSVSSLCGGNLSLVVNHLGILDISFFKDKILVLEDIGEYDYKIDRMMIQLRRSGVFKSVKAVLLGQFSEMLYGKEKIPDFEENLVEQISNSETPCFYDATIGHIRNAVPLYMNCPVEVEYHDHILSLKYSISGLV